jgi:hypothetical protein
VAEADPAAAVADDDQGGEAEPPAALHHAGAAADLHRLLTVVAPAFAVPVSFTPLVGHD